MLKFRQEIGLHCPLVKIEVSDDDIRKEPMLFSSDYWFSWAKAGPLTKMFLSNLPSHDFVIDSKVVMLMDGWYPCIPGWHLDNIPRGDDGQPNFSNLEDCQHYFAVFGDVSKTEFISHGEIVELPEDRYFNSDPSKALYGEWSRILNERVLHNYHATTKIKSGSMYHFNNTSFHRGTAATGRGWRFFIRASKGSAQKVRNEVRSQVQVYLTQPEAGW